MKTIKTLLIVSTIAFYSCSNEPIQQNEALLEHAKTIQKELLKRHVSFEIDMNLVLKHNLKYKGKPVFGLSDPGAFSFGIISIDSGTFVEYNSTYPERVEALLLHEIGHNKFDQRHSDGIRDDQNRINIMKYGSWQYVNNKNRSAMYDAFVEKLE